MKLNSLKTWRNISPPMQTLLTDTSRNMGGMRAALAYVFDECVAEKIPLGKDTLSDLGKFGELYEEIEAQMQADIENEQRRKVCLRCAHWKKDDEFCAVYNFRIRSGAIVGCISFSEKNN